MRSNSTDENNKSIKVQIPPHVPKQQSHNNTTIQSSGFTDQTELYQQSVLTGAVVTTKLHGQ
jgi:hypothetical protein